MALLTSALYNQPAFSDVIIAFSGRRIYCHKLILCSKSEYFMKLCAPDGGFSESTQKVVELRDDDPDAVEHVLLYIYTGCPSGQDENWKLQLQIANSAHKYLLTDLAKTAMNKFIQTASAISPPEKIFEAIMHIRKSTLLPEALEVAKSLETQHVHKLLKVRPYRELVDKDSTLIWKYLDQFNDALVAQIQVTLRVCRKCRTSLLLTSGNSGPNCKCLTLYASPNYENFQIWVPAAKLGDYNQRLPEYRC
ncbi:hypothetical protein CBER1_04504 [Cercospora berteroae]|uniref:BTB domain-containing protein n=1 Tax=Cercospora berteroae TaxID=357750 RepID=A0A2S6CF03_9PEZI|nr:hypothetical protein CBER1_04504 [Cercospora berteroae]